MDKYLLTLIVFLPLAGTLAIWLVPKGRDTAVRMIALATMTLGLALGVALWFMFNPDQTNLQFAELNRCHRLCGSA